MQNFNGIASLPPELLCDIFLKNTEQDDPMHNRLITARHSSQVCQSWRSILLAFPSIWGRLINLDDYFDRKKETWMQEVVSRSGGAPLWITGRIFSFYTSTCFISLLKENWERVQHLEIGAVNRGSDERWSFLCRPAPNLERLSIKLFHWETYYERHAGALVIPSLFSDVAPRLRAFCIPGSFKFKMNTPCFSNMRVFTFPRDYTVPMIFSLLKLMPRLTHLRVDAYKQVEHPPVERMDFTRIDIPLLEGLQIVSRDSSEILALLECIKPSSRCGLLLTHEIYWNRDHPGPLMHICPYPPPTTHDVILKWVLAYIKGCGRPPNFIKLDTNQIEHDGKRLVRLAISDCSKLRVMHIEQSVLYLEVFLDSARGPSLVQELSASSDLFRAAERLHVNSMSVPSGLYSVYQDFSCVTELTLTAPDSHYTSDVKTWYTRDDGTPQPREAALFPSLHTVILDISRVSDGLVWIVDYLEYRWEIGLPVCVLDVSRSLYATDPGCRSMRDRLNKFNGLVVRWKAEA
ncbi:hypothetical protein D9613_011848 [Agrocybe pediades]|uniref:F-box domain-containing protein n=1 Tax=Agrocybe pediades TaxID=84607 RepID=A0A8H4QKN9_9AGAR|nr:hypothetical protein D9613_011848 [Agrocybe pediades]